MTHSPEVTRPARRTVSRALHRPVVACLLCIALVQAGCVDNGQMGDPSDEQMVEQDDMATEDAAKAFRTRFVSINGNRQRLFGSWNYLWAMLADSLEVEKLVSLGFSRSGERATTNFMFFWSRPNSATFGAEGIIPTHVKLCGHLLPIEPNKFLAALDQLAATFYNEQAVQSTIELYSYADPRPSLDAIAYRRLAEVFYGVVAPVLSEEVKADVALALSGKIVNIGMAARNFVQGYQTMRGWALRRGLITAGAVFVLTSQVLGEFLQQSLILPAGVWQAVAGFVCS